MKPVVSLGDASLFRDDLELLMPPAWLNDRLISFWCEHLRLSVLNNHPAVAILPPNITFFVALTSDKDDLHQVAKAHALPSRDLVLLTVNNSREATISPTSHSATGTHWSLLIFHRPDNAIYSLDSLPTSPNLPISRHLSTRLAAMCNAPTATFRPLPSPSQTNSYDCGAFVCVFATDAIHHFLQRKPLTSLYLPPATLPPDAISTARQEIGKLACRLIDTTTASATATATATITATTRNKKANMQTPTPTPPP